MKGCGHDGHTLSRRAHARRSVRSHAGQPDRPHRSRRAAGACPARQQILDAPDGELCIPPALFRLLQLVLLPEVLGANSGPILYVAAKRFSGSLELQSIQDLKSWFATMMLGELEVELDEEKVLVKLSKCMTCYRLPPTGSALCDFERGLVDGVLEHITGAEVLTKETLCWGLGDTVCQFEAYDRRRRLPLPETAPTARCSAACWSGSPTSPTSPLENLRLVGDHRYAETRDALTGCTTSATCASTPPSSWPARAATIARSPSSCSTSTALPTVNDARRRRGRRRRAAPVGRPAPRPAARLRPDLPLRRRRVPARAARDRRRQADQALAACWAALGEMVVRGRRRDAVRSAPAPAWRPSPKTAQIVEELVAKATTTMYVGQVRAMGQIGLLLAARAAGAAALPRLVLARRGSVPAVPERLEILAVGRLDADLRPAFAHYERLIAGLCRLLGARGAEVALRGRAPGGGAARRRAASAGGPAGRRRWWWRSTSPAAPTTAKPSRRGCRAWSQVGPVTFVVGGSLGLADDVKAAARRAAVAVARSRCRTSSPGWCWPNSSFAPLRSLRGETYHH